MRDAASNHYNDSKISHTNPSGGVVRIQVLQETSRDQDDLDFDSGMIPLETYKVGDFVTKLGILSSMSFLDSTNVCVDLD